MNRKTFACICAFLFAVGLVCPPANADVIYDNFGPADAYDAEVGSTISGPGSDSGERDWAMPFAPGGNYRLDSITVAVSYWSGINRVDVILAGDSGGVPGAILEQKFIISVPGYPGAALTANFAGTTPLNAGQQYWVWLSVPDDGDCGWYRNSTGDSGLVASSAGGPWNPISSSRKAVRVDGTLVPEPGSMALLGLGVVGLALFRRKRRQH